GDPNADRIGAPKEDAVYCMRASGRGYPQPQVEARAVAPPRASPRRAAATSAAAPASAAVNPPSPSPAGKTPALAATARSGGNDSTWATTRAAGASATSGAKPSTVQALPSPSMGTTIPGPTSDAGPGRAARGWPRKTTPNTREKQATASAAMRARPGAAKTTSFPAPGAAPPRSSA